MWDPEGGEAFIPRRGDRQRSMSILHQAESWYAPQPEATMWTKLLAKLAPYRKALAAIATVAAIAAWPVFQTVAGDGDITAGDWRAIGIAAVGAVLVYFTRNQPRPPEPPAYMSRYPTV